MIFTKEREFIMKNKNCLCVSVMLGTVLLAGCAGTYNDEENGVYATPTVDYVERLDVFNAPHKDSFLNQLALNYRSYGIYNARTSGYPDIGELFAQKAVGAFSGERPFPESLDNWNINSESQRFEISNAYNELIEKLKTDAVQLQPKLAAESQAKFDCWISATASGQIATAQECRNRFFATMQALKDCMDGRAEVVAQAVAAVEAETIKPESHSSEKYYPETNGLSAMSGSTRMREGFVIVNNVNIPSNLVNVVPVPMTMPVVNQAVPAQPQPVIFNQNIYGSDGGEGDGEEWSAEFVEAKHIPVPQPEPVTCPNSDQKTCMECDASEYSESETCPEPEACPMAEPQTCPNPTIKEVYVKEDHVVPVGNDDYVSRDEFISMMMAMREELKAINDRLDNIERAPVATSNDKTIIKVQQIPLEPKQHIMEEIFEIRFDFNQATIKPEYEDLIKKLASTTQANKNIKVSVVGHTDTAGSSDYNYALGGRRAEAVQKMLIKYGIPSTQIIAVSAGEEDLKVPTPNNTPNAENRRVRVVKEVHYTEKPKAAPIVVEEYTEIDDIDDIESYDDVDDKDWE